jgi:hypothetical protein
MNYSNDKQNLILYKREHCIAWANKFRHYITIEDIIGAP